jgi:hypothetical protein
MMFMVLALPHPRPRTALRLLARGLRALKPARNDPPAGRFEIVGDHSPRTSEGWVERISLKPGHAEIRVVLDDGTATSTSLRSDDLEWLGVHVGQIVSLRASRSTGDPGFPLLRECLDICR